jgi:hypothetical protein
MTVNFFVNIILMIVWFNKIVKIQTTRCGAQFICPILKKKIDDTFHLWSSLYINSASMTVNVAPARFNQNNRLTTITVAKLHSYVKALLPIRDDLRPY